MASLVERTVATDRVAGIIQLVRRRWRLRHALAGLGIVVALTVAALWLAALAMERAGFSEASITWARVAVSLVRTFLGLVVGWAIGLAACLAVVAAARALKRFWPSAPHAAPGNGTTHVSIASAEQAVTA